MSQIPRLIQAIQGPLLVEPRFGRLAAGVFLKKLLGESFDGARLHADMGIPTPGEREAKSAPRIAVIPIYGVIDQHPQSMGTSTDEIAAMVDAAMQSPNIDAVLYDVDSPGGTVPGVPETAEKMFGYRGVKPQLAISNSLMASAALWLGLAADEVWVSPSGEIGSHGVYTIHEDWSKALEQEGVKVTAIQYGENKTEGAPWEPPSADFLTRTQARVDEIGAWFTKDLARFRGLGASVVKSTFGQGIVFNGKDAVSIGMADRVGTFEEAVVRLGKLARKTSKGSRAAVEREKLRLDSVA
jgi:signal peptide peptidase SppA